MNWLLTKLRWKNSSNIEIYYNAQFPLNDILSVLYPLFGYYYQYNGLVQMISDIEHIFCAYDTEQGRCIGCALVKNRGMNGALYIMLFGVDESAQGRGTGTRLLNEVIEWARQAGYRYILLDVHVNNYKAIGLYEKVGFVKQKYLPNHYHNLPKYPPHAFRMILPLQ